VTILGQIIHPRFLEGIGVPFWPSLCTVQAATQTAGTTGELVTVWANVAGLVDLACNIAPVSISEQRWAERTVETGTHRVYVEGYYTTITAMQHAIVDDVTYNILSVEQDSQHAVTVLRVEIVS
jgi:head-tail adaptor